MDGLVVIIVTIGVVDKFWILFPQGYIAKRLFACVSNGFIIFGTTFICGHPK